MAAALPWASLNAHASRWPLAAQRVAWAPALARLTAGPGRPSPRPLPMDALSSGCGTHAKAAAIAGGVIGLLVTALIFGYGDADRQHSTPLAVLAVGGAAGGAIVGGLLGALTPRRCG